MIKLVFSLNRELFRIEIEDKHIWYTDRIWKKTVRLIPKDEDFIKKITFSRNKIPLSFTSLFELTEEEKKEYDNAKDDKELAKICIQDARKKGALLISKDGIN